MEFQGHPESEDGTRTGGHGEYRYFTINLPYVELVLVAQSTLLPSHVVQPTLTGNKLQKSIAELFPIHGAQDL